LIETAWTRSPWAGPVHVKVTTPSANLLTRVVHHGPGIAQAAHERIFEPFQRTNHARVRGAGLGLAIARGFAVANGGRVWAESRAGQGSTFILSLPLVESAQ